VRFYADDAECIPLLTARIARDVWLDAFSHSWNLVGRSKVEFVGLQNYRTIFTSSDFHHSVLITVTYLVIAVTVEILLGVWIALLLDTQFIGRGFLRSFILLPMVMAPVVVGLIWRWMFNAEWGLANAFLNYLGKTGLPWLTNPQLALLSIIIADIWEWTPFIALVTLAGLQAVPVELREASLVDGASWLQYQFRVALPAVKSVLWVGVLFRFLDAIRFVDKVFVMTYGGPGNATTVLGFLTYTRAFKMWQLGYAAALGMILLVLTIALANALASRIRQEER